MEFHEKLQELRKSRGLTQEELAEALFVSRTAISKWETNRGYPNIDSLKDISNFFSVSIDELLDVEKMLTIAEEENKTNMKNMCDFLFGIVDILSIFLIVMPLYPHTVDGHVYSVNLWRYVETTVFNRCVYWGLFVTLIMCGVLRGCIRLTRVSVIVGAIAVIYLALAREAYAATLCFGLLIIKFLLIYKSSNSTLRR